VDVRARLFPTTGWPSLEGPMHVRWLESERPLHYGSHTSGIHSDAHQFARRLIAVGESLNSAEPSWNPRIING
jgi:hypothetical protein